MQNEDPALREAILKVRAGYADQSKFADHEPAAYFREFVRRIDAALSATPTPAPVCIGCDGHPAPENNPCAVCGREAPTPAPIDNEALVEEVARAIGNALYACGKFKAPYDDSDWTRGPCILAARAVLALPSIAKSGRGQANESAWLSPENQANSGRVESALVEEAIGALEEITRRTGLLIHQNTGRWNMRVEADSRTVQVLTINQEISRSALAKLKEGRS